MNEPKRDSEILRALERRVIAGSLDMVSALLLAFSIGKTLGCFDEWKRNRAATEAISGNAGNN